MSLLMDALKKAEQEKKEAAKRLKDAQAHTGEELELAEKDQVDLTKSPDEEQQIAQPEETPNEEVSDKPHTTLSLEDIESTSSSGEFKQPVIKEGDSPDVKDIGDITLENPGIFVSELSIEGQDRKSEDLAGPAPEPEQKPAPAPVPEPEVDLDQTFANSGVEIEETSSKPVELAFEDTVQSNEVDDIYDTISESRPVTSVISAAELVNDIGGGKDQPTPVAAQTVFTAIGSGRQIEGVKWVVFLVLCLVVATSLSVIYYFKIVPINIESSSPLVAKGIETDPATLPPVEIPEEILQGAVISGSSIEEPAIGPEHDEILATEDTGTVEDIKTGEENLAEQVDEVITKKPDSSLELSEVIPKDIAKLLPKNTEQDIALTEQPRGLPQNIEVDPSIIKITRSRTGSKFDEVINSAYLAYKNGEYKIAEDNYRIVLNDNPENKDALLGLAAIELIKGDTQKAYSLYYRVLKLYPHDSVARTSLISMQDGKNPEQSESAIKLMLQQEPESAFLYFSLGNIYASQSRWADAQQAFFDAYRFETSNPDYAFNLAVSLDRIGQNKTALDYYNVALQLADNGNVNFNTATVLARINSLSSRNSPAR